MKTPIISTFKHIKYCVAVVLYLLSISSTKAQAVENTIVPKPSIAIVDFDVRGYKMSQQQAIQFVINELIRVEKYEVMDKYDIEYMIKRDSLDVSSCFSKICLTQVGTKLGVDKMFTGSIAQLGDNLNVTVRILDVKSGVFEATKVKEFLNISGNEFQMIRICINDLFGIQNDADLVSKLTKKSEFDNTINNPYTLRLKADGPRMGMTYATGYLSDVLTRPRNEGGYDGNPYMFQFGYQIEKQYLNEGNFQALFEIIPMVTGLDQGQFIPSLTLLNGLRNNVNGWEFAFGPTFGISKYSEGYMKNTGTGNEEFIIDVQDPLKYFSLTEEATANGSVVETRPDSRVTTSINYGFLFAAGKTFKSGKLNLPVNVFVVPGKNGLRFGVSMGWNGKDRYDTK
jgi:TolB-like protein